MIDPSGYSIVEEDKVHLVSQGVGGFSEDEELVGIYVEVDNIFLLQWKIKQQLKQMYLQAKEFCFNLSDLPNIFCRIHNFEQIPFSDDIEVDFVLDTDTDRIYSPFFR